MPRPDRSLQFNNTVTGINALPEWLKEQAVYFDENTLLAIVNTGIHKRLIWLFCSDHNLPLHIGNAVHLKWTFGIARGNNDLIDSIRICQYACSKKMSRKRRLFLILYLSGLRI